MKILSAKVDNFGSYKHLEFQFDGLGLALISGSTGAGKSTLLDIVPWILYGRTAKDGSVSDVVSWQSEGQPTRGELTLELRGRVFRVIRSRGPNGLHNDLHWCEPQGKDDYFLDNTYLQHRGKDLNDTQKLVEQRLGVSAEAYLSGAYFHEFSPTGTFFSSPAKSRRELFERVADLSFPLKLSTSSTDLRRGARASADALRVATSKLEGRQLQIQTSIDSTKKSADNWERSQKQKIDSLSAKAKTFEEDNVKATSLIRDKVVAWDESSIEQKSLVSARIVDLKAIVKDSDYFRAEECKILDSALCKACGSRSPESQEALLKLAEDTHENDKILCEIDTLVEALESFRAKKNPYTEQLSTSFYSKNTYLEQVEEEKKAYNPFLAPLKVLENDLEKLDMDVLGQKTELYALESRISRLTRLIELSSTLRGELLRKTVREIEAQTNAYLEKHFDAEIRVGFSVGDADNLEISIQKSGYECNFKQLSRGQRALLRLCFSVSVMKATANNAGTHFNMVAFDEVLDGMDVDLKVKAVGLFEQLGVDHSTVLVIDHATEVKSCFTRQYTVEMIGDTSVLGES